MPDKDDNNAVKPMRRAVRSPEFREIYANTVQGAYTPWDIELTFGKLERQDGEMFVSELTTVVFSPQHAKALSMVIAHAVEQWESQHGKIMLTSEQEPKAARSKAARKGE